MSPCLLAGACSLLLFSNSDLALHPHAFPHICLAEQPIERALATARASAEAVTIAHSKRIVHYTEYLIGSNGRYPRKHDLDYEWRTIPMTFIETATGQQRVAVFTRQIVNGALPVILFSDDYHFIIALEQRPSGSVWNWWNTPFTVLAPEGWVVGAMHWERYPSKTSVVYTPPSADLLDAFPELFFIGEMHFNEDLAWALEALRDVPSHTQEKVSVATLIETHLPDLPRAIVAIEHADPYDVEWYEHNGGRLDPLRRAFAIFGANGINAFSITRSSAGANGVMQIMPGTCIETRAQYPDAKIPRGCSTPLHGHPIEIMSALPIIDYHLSVMAQYAFLCDGSTVEQFLARDDLADLVLAAYNGGPSRVGRALKSPQWRDALRLETRGYLEKYELWRSRN